MLIIRRRIGNTGFKELRIRQRHVRAALVWLKQNNPLYAAVRIDQDRINALPEDGIAEDLPHIDDDEREGPPAAAASVDGLAIGSGADGPANQQPAGERGAVAKAAPTNARFLTRSRSQPLS